MQAYEKKKKKKKKKKEHKKKKKKKKDHTCIKKLTTKTMSERLGSC